MVPAGLGLTLDRLADIDGQHHRTVIVS